MSLSDALEDGASEKSIEEAFGDAESIAPEAAAGIGPLQPTQPNGDVALNKIETAGIGQIDEERPSKIVSRRLDRIEACYTRKLENHSDIGGLVDILVTVRADGRVTRANPLRDTVGHGVGRCVTDIVEETRLPPAKGGKVVAKLTFVFAPGEGKPTDEERDR